MMGISVWQLLIVLVIVMLLFGTKRLRSIGSDLGGAIQGFRRSVKEGGDEIEGVAAALEDHGQRAGEGAHQVDQDERAFIQSGR